MRKDRKNVWLGVSGIVVNERGEWLVVKKTYGGLKGKWSFPAGFVDEGETVEEAIVREVLEETGIRAQVEGVVGIRSGVLQKGISDNMIIFLLQANSTELMIEPKEIQEAEFRTPESLAQDPDSSLLLVEFAKRNVSKQLIPYDHFNPGNHFGYRQYILFL
ncbi:NUDIX domain-containing protein [Bacillus sp. FJAT-47783]|uniref:NUDIX hydrolase n=1 Tax=Bacillus sp. FJAT-47783 TaxID=2922712 RepID=UPI001FAC31AC|nr:NUDIX domain-containing protein [Bacillus sp. FJAT-47783]